MALYRYKAATADGQVQEGTLEGASREQVVTQLHALGQIPIRVEEGRRASGPIRWRPGRSGGRVTPQQIASLTAELSTLLRAGMALDRALSTLIGLAGESPLGKTLVDIRERIKGGSTLADAVEAQGGLFNRFYVTMLRAGEAGGALDHVLERLAEHLDRAREVREAVLSAMIYPAILVFVALLSIFVLLAYVVPQFADLFADSGRVLPLSTRFVIALGDGVRDYGWLAFLLAGAGIWLLRRQLATAAGQYRWHGRLLRLPMVGSIVTRVEVARFARTLGTLLHNGVPLLAAMTIVKETIGNQVIAEAVGRVASSLREGQSVARLLEETGRFPEFAVQMIHVGEESGRLEDLLAQVAVLYDRETQALLKRALAMLEPVLILVLGVVIAGIVISVLSAILGINQLVF